MKYTKVVEVDTDGIIVCQPVDTQALNDRIAALYSDTFGTAECYMQLEEEEFGAAYFYRAKNYIMQTTDGKLVKHGVKFKSSRYCAIYQKAMNALSVASLSGDENLTNLALSLLDLSQYEMADFRMKASLTKDPDHYDNPNSLHAKLGRKLREELGTEPGKEQIEYIVTRGKNYDLAAKVTDISQIDADYYRNELEKVFLIFGVSNPEQLSLF